MEIKPLTKTELEQYIGEELDQIGTNAYVTKDGMLIRPYAGIKMTVLKKSFKFHPSTGEPWQLGDSVTLFEDAKGSTEDVVKQLEINRAGVSSWDAWVAKFPRGAQKPWAQTIERYRARVVRWYARQQD